MHKRITHKGIFEKRGGIKHNLCMYAPFTFRRDNNSQKVHL